MPLAGAFSQPGSITSEDELIPLKLMWCSRCQLLQTGESVDRDTLFKDYSYHSSIARPLVEHFEGLASTIQAWLPGEDDDLVIDVGCNDGVLLNPLHRMGIRCLGIDPSDVAANASNENGWDLINDYLSPNAVLKVIAEYGKASAIVASNVLAHNDNVHELVQCIRALLQPDGIFVCEVHYAGDLIEQVQFDTIYHEHALYYSVNALRTLFAMHDMQLWMAHRIPTHSGSIRVFASPKHSSRKAWDGRELGNLSSFNVEEFRTRALRARHRINDVVLTLNMSGDTVWAYGAAGRCTIMLNWCGLNEDLIPCVIDASPRRCGRQVPGVDVPIISPEVLNRHVKDGSAPRALLVTAWNYLDDIIKQHPDYRGWWVKPLPNVELR